MRSSSPPPLIGREIDPQGELHTLSEYRQRYARYHTDADLRALRATMPLIAVWDDHDIANDIWRNGVGGQNLATTPVLSPGARRPCRPGTNGCPRATAPTR